jgi:adenylate cyclase
MYAPVQWQEQLFGVICVDSPEMTNNFTEADLHFLIAIGQHAGMALAEQAIRAELQQNSKLTDRLLTNFSPKIRGLLLDHAKMGRLRPGGTKSEVTVLFCDMVEFTRRAAEMDAADVVNMLNDYFQPLVDAIFRHDGTLDKFVGDGILAVFGSPEPDTEQQLKAARTAVAMLESVRATSQLRTARGDQTCQVRLGLHSGEAFHGFVGGVDRLEFTVVGDVVNRACRYCQSAGENEIFLSPEVFQRIFNQIRAEKTTAQTKEGELVAYRLKGIKG